MLLLKLNADALAAKLTRRDQCRTGTGEGVKHDALRRAKRFYRDFVRGPNSSRVGAGSHRGIFCGPS